MPSNPKKSGESELPILLSLGLTTRQHQHNELRRYAPRRPVGRHPVNDPAQDGTR